MTLNEWPEDSDAALTSYYGKPGSETNLVMVTPPYPMFIPFLPGIPRLKSIRCHGRVARSLEAVLVGLRDRFGLAWIHQNGLDQWGGCFNFRKMRGGTSLSRHSWGIAVDLDPVRNSLRSKWPGEAKMPVEAVEAFEAEGWKSYARAKGWDAMHFQATQ